MNKDIQKRKIIRFLKGKINKDIDAFCIYQWIERCHFHGWWDLGIKLSTSVPPNSLDQHYHKRLEYLLSVCRSNYEQVEKAIDIVQGSEKTEKRSMSQLNEQKYSLQSRLDIMPLELQMLFMEFLDRMMYEIQALQPISMNFPWVRTHVRGVTCFSSPIRSFLCADFRQSFILLHVFADSDKFQELEPIKNYPRQWYYRIKSREHLNHAVLYAKESYEITVNEMP